MNSYLYVTKEPYLFGLSKNGRASKPFPSGTRVETPLSLSDPATSGIDTIQVLINGKDYYAYVGSLRAACGVVVSSNAVVVLPARSPVPAEAYPKLRPCEWRVNVSSDWRAGFFHKWVVVDENICGIVELPDGTADYFHITHIRFTFTNSPKED